MDLEEYRKKREVILEQMFWIGDGSESGASEKGFELMIELSKLNKDFIKENNNEHNR